MAAGRAGLPERGCNASPSYRATFARALWASGQRAQATEVAADARARLVKVGADGASALTELEAWQRARGARR